MNHVILTRFNLPTPGHESFLRTAPGWLEERFELFEKFCLPSVLKQTCTSFRWLIYFDPETPDWAKERISAHVAKGYYRALYRVAVPKQQLLDDIHVALTRIEDRLLTTRLDNDDMLAPDFVARLQVAADPLSSGRIVLNFPQGFVLCEGRAYQHRDKSNPFASMSETWDGALTIWHDHHTRLPAVASIVQLDPEPAWLQLVHGRNVSNRVRGWLVDPGELGGFPVPAGVLKPQNRRALLADHAYNLLIRNSAESLRRVTVGAAKALLPHRFYAKIRLTAARGVAALRARR